MTDDDKLRLVAVAATIRAEKSARRWTQKELAERSGIPVQSFLRYELGRRDIPIATLMRIVDALDMPFHTFARRVEDRLEALKRDGSQP